MTRNGKGLVWGLLLTGILLVGSPGLAQPPNDKGAPPDKSADTLTELKLQMQKMLEQVKALQDAVSDLKRPPEPAPEPADPVARELAKLRADMAILKGQLDQLQQDINNLKVRQAFSPPSMGKIRLVNTFPGPRTIMVNNRTYRLQAGETKLLDEPVGRFTYEVFGYHTEPQVRDLDTVQEFTITVFPIFR